MTYSFGNDFQFYWLASRMFLEGQNPYESQLFTELFFEKFQFILRDGYVYPYPPWALLFFLPFALLSYKAGLAVWIVTQLLAVVGVAVMCKRLFINVHQNLILLLIFTLLFPPVFLTIAWGQCGLHVLLLSLISFALAKSDRSILAGFLFSFAGLKPQAFVAVICFLLLRMLLRGNKKFLGSFIIGCLLQVSILLAFDPMVFTRYFAQVNVIFSTHAEWQSTSLAAYLVLLTGMTLIPLLFQGLSLFVGGLLAYRAKNEERALLGALFCSVTLAGYIWAHTYVFLLPLWICLSAFLWQRVQAFAVFLLLGQFILACLFLHQDAVYRELPMYFYLPILLVPLFWKHSTGQESSSET